MKKYLKSAGIIPCLIISLCLILMLTTCAVYYRNPSTGSTGNFYGQDVMYVYASTKSSYDSLLGYRTYLVRDEPSAAALVSFVFLSMSSIMLGIGAALPLFKNDKPVIRFSGILNIISMALIFGAAIAITFVPRDWSYFTSGGWSDGVEFHLGGGYLTVCLLSFLASALCLPSVIACLKKPKAEQTQAQE